MTPSQLVKCLEEAEKLLRQYGHCVRIYKGQQEGLIPVSAVGLTALPKDVVKRVAPLLANRHGEHAWSEVIARGRRSDIPCIEAYVDRQTLVNRELEECLGGAGLLANSPGILPKVIKLLKALG
jgi:hypothetical protein